VSRSGYTDGDCDSAEDFLRMMGYNANVRRCLAGRAGQAFLWELYQALEALPRRRIIKAALEKDGDYCSLGAVARARGVELLKLLRIENADDLNVDETLGILASLLGIKDMLAREIMYQNDAADEMHEACGPPAPHHSWLSWCATAPTRDETPEERWLRIRAWVADELRDIP
jgi:hypothetical protein